MNTVGYTKLGPDVSLGPTMIRTIWVLLSISTIVFFARLYVKLRTVRRLFYDDLSMVVALVSQL